MSVCQAIAAKSRHHQHPSVAFSAVARNMPDYRSIALEHLEWTSRPDSDGSSLHIRIDSNLRDRHSNHIASYYQQLRCVNPGCQFEFFDSDFSFASGPEPNYNDHFSTSKCRFDFHAVTTRQNRQVRTIRRFGVFGNAIII